MNAPALTAKSIHGLKFLLPFFTFIIGFFISYQQDRIHVSEVGHLAWLHWRYASDLKDDMAVIDWSKNLEGMEAILAFQVKSGPNIITDGGNREYLGVRNQDGISFELPDRWSYVQSLKKDSPASDQFTMVYHSVPGPLLWGLVTSAASLLPLLMSGFISKDSSKNQKNNPGGSSSLGVPSQASSTPILPADPPSVKINNPHIFIDKHYLIQQVTPEAALWLQKSSDDLSQSHLFDLKPTSRLIQAIDGNEEVKLLNPFLSYPLLSVFLKPDPNGTLLFLERREETKAPQNH